MDLSHEKDVPIKAEESLNIRQASGQDKHGVNAQMTQHEGLSKEETDGRLISLYSLHLLHIAPSFRLA